MWSVQCGCGLFNVGVVCLMWVWFCLLDIMLVLNIMGSPLTSSMLYKIFYSKIFFAEIGCSYHYCDVLLLVL